MAPFRAVVPALPAAVSLVLVVGDVEAASGASGPGIPVISQVGAERRGDDLHLSFHAGAADGDPLVVWFQARVHGVWRTVAGPFTGTTAVLPAGELGAATGADILRLVATDGLHPVASDVLLPDLPPPALQVAVRGVPGHGRVAARRALTFEALVSGGGRTREPRDAVAWTLDGEPVGTAAEVTLAGVAPGEHTLKLVATAGDGRTAQTESRLDVQADSDGDGLTDSFERDGGLDAKDPSDAGSDTDGDRLTAWQEQAAGSDPVQVDTDGDRYADAVEVAGGSDPADKASVPVRLHGDPAASVPRLGARTAEGGGKGLAALLAFTALAAAGGGFVLVNRRRAPDPPPV